MSSVRDNAGFINAIGSFEKAMGSKPHAFKGATEFQQSVKFLSSFMEGMGTSKDEIKALQDGNQVFNPEGKNAKVIRNAGVDVATKVMEANPSTAAFMKIPGAKTLFKLYANKEGKRMMSEIAGEAALTSGLIKKYLPALQGMWDECKSQTQQQGQAQGKSTTGGVVANLIQQFQKQASQTPSSVNPLTSAFKTLATGKKM